MIFNKTKLDGVYVIEPELKVDERGYFGRIFCKEELAKHGINFNIVQMNHSLTKTKWSIRGMHFQKEPKSEDKIVQCLIGKVYDVIVDIRENSWTFGQWVAEKLTEENKKMIYIPRGFAHGFQTLTDNCVLQYFMSEFYSPEHASGVRWNDPFFNISWPIKNPTVISEKDQNWRLIQKI
ncbi:MAG: dTDP-4-dehydrorhamnose 3,5-epimerase [Candidatus Altarchaeum sp.]|nr:dTDP-4-dehydrorhamnose 3,5-epimerase [Candidatus Altarchaeum sp.]